MPREKPAHAYETARRLRKAMSLPEVLLWRHLRGSPGSRQHPVGRFVIDFYAPGARLGIEIDGIAHDMGHRPDRDHERDAWLADQGIRIVRIAAAEVLDDPAGMAERLMALCLTKRRLTKRCSAERS